MGTIWLNYQALEYLALTPTTPQCLCKQSMFKAVCASIDGAKTDARTRCDIDVDSEIQNNVGDTSVTASEVGFVLVVSKHMSACTLSQRRQDRHHSRYICVRQSSNRTCFRLVPATYNILSIGSGYVYRCCQSAQYVRPSYTKCYPPFVLVDIQHT